MKESMRLWHATEIRLTLEDLSWPRCPIRRARALIRRSSLLWEQACNRNRPAEEDPMTHVYCFGLWARLAPFAILIALCSAAAVAADRPASYDEFDEVGIIFSNPNCSIEDPACPGVILLDQPTIDLINCGCSSGCSSCEDLTADYLYFPAYGQRRYYINAGDLVITRSHGPAKLRPLRRRGEDTRWTVGARLSGATTAHGRSRRSDSDHGSSGRVVGTQR